MYTESPDEVSSLLPLGCSSQLFSRSSSRCLTVDFRAFPNFHNACIENECEVYEVNLEEVSEDSGDTVGNSLIIYFSAFLSFFFLFFFNL